MNRLISAAVLSFSIWELFAGATIEGIVQVPASAKAPPAHSGRYQIKASSPVGEPDPIQAVVFLEGAFPEGAKPPPGTNRVEQKHFQFSPGILAVQKGAQVAFPNLDDDYHNVFSYSKAKRFDLGRYRKDEKAAAQTFDKPGVVKIYCEIHEHMRGTILVLETPHFTAVNPKTGAFQLKDLPAGKYTLKVWIDEKTLEKPVELKDGETLRVDFK